MILRKAFFVFVLASAFLTLRAAEGASPPPPAGKVVLVILENTNASSAQAQPFLAQLAKSGVSFSQMYAENHPSQGNYIALVSGETHGIAHDASININAPHLGDLIEEKGKDWRVYAEQYPGGCFLGKRSGGYVRKHNPLISFTNVQNNPQRCAKIVEASEFDRDLQANTLPDFSFYIPDQDNDGHDTGVAFADQWLARRFQNLLQDPAAMKETLFIVTFDESSILGGNLIYTSIVGGPIRAGTVISDPHTHYSLLRLIEEVLGLRSLGLNDAKALPILGIWR